MDDQLSSLPCELRDRILSFLPTEDAIKTTILSSKWKNVCSTLSHLSFSRYNFLSKSRKAPDLIEKNFVEYVNQTLSHHDDSSIYDFLLFLSVFDSNNFFDHLSDWVSFALSHNAHIIFLSLHYVRRVPNIPLYLFTSSNSLTKLSLSSVNLTSSTGTKFPNLESLILNIVELFDVNVTNQLLSSSTVLENLQILHCSWKNPFDILVIPAPRLKFLKLQNKHRFHEIQHASPNLYKLVYEGPPYSYINPSSTLKDVSFVVPNFSDVTSPWASKTIKGLCNVVDLSLDGSFIEFLVKEGHLLLSELCTSCYSLEKLSLSLYVRKDQVRVMMLLLRRFPGLQTLCIHVEGVGEDQDSSVAEEYWKTVELHTGNLTVERLKTVKIKNCRESEIEVDMIRYLLESAPALEKMNISLRRCYQQGDPTFINFCERMQNYTRASPSASLSISPDNIRDSKPYRMMELLSRQIQRK